MTPKWEGGWAGGTASLITYYPGDVVSYNNIVYIVKSIVVNVPIGSPSPDNDMSKWEVFVAGSPGSSGTSGTSGSSGTSGTSGTPTSGADILLSNMTINLDTTADQTITLSGGSRYLISSVILFDPSSVPVAVASDGQIWSGPSRTGTIYYQTLDSTGPIEYLDFLISADNYISVPAPICWPPPCNNLYIISSSTLYFSLTTAGTSGLSVKMNIYGKVIS
jgi:hypothetical protein